jgi:hypothetical protein
MINALLSQQAEAALPLARRVRRAHQLLQAVRFWAARAAPSL